MSLVASVWAGKIARVNVGPQGERGPRWQENTRPTLGHHLPILGFPSHRRERGESAEEVGFELPLGKD